MFTFPHNQRNKTKQVKKGTRVLYTLPSSLAKTRVTNPTSGKLIKVFGGTWKDMISSGKWAPDLKSGKLKPLKKLTFKTPRTRQQSKSDREKLRPIHENEVNGVLVLQAKVFTNPSDYVKFYADMRKPTVDALTERFEQVGQFRAQLTCKAIFNPVVISGDTTIALEDDPRPFYLNSEFEPIRNVEAIENFYDEAVRVQTDLIETIKTSRSGLVFKIVESFDVNMSRYNAQRGGSYFKVLDASYDRRLRSAGVVNIKSDDQMCFPRAVYASQHPVKANPNRECHYKDWVSAYDCSMLSYPTTFSDIAKFEVANKINIYVHQFDVGTGKTQLVYPSNMRTHFKRIDTFTCVDLVLLQSAEKKHFCPCNSLKVRALYYKQMKGSNVIKPWCRACARVIPTVNGYWKHIESCWSRDVQQVMLPSQEKKFVELKGLGQKRKRLPVVCYADFECVILPEDEKKGKRTRLAGSHVLSGFSLVTASPTIPDLETQVTRHGENCVEEFFHEIEKLITRYHSRLQRHRTNMVLTKEQWREHEQATECYLCTMPFNDEKPSLKKVRDHDHESSEFLGSAHSKCNLYDKGCQDFNIFFHNLANYDLHLIFKTLREYLENSKNPNIRVVPETEEKFKTLSIKLKNIPMTIRFKDSFKFMARSLDSLVSNLRKSESPFYNLRKHMNGFTKDEVDLLTRKGIYFYEHADNFEQFELTELPTQEQFFSKLTQKGVSDDEYAYAQQIWKVFRCQNRWDYHDLYLKTDTLLLADVFESFRTVSMENYKIDPAHYISVPSFAWDAMLLLTKDEVSQHGGLELITDMEKYLFVENGLRGGISMISNRYSKANNQYMEDYDPSQEDKFIKYLDMNSLYATAMTDSLPLNTYSWDKNPGSVDVMSIDDHADMGCFLEVDIDYPDNLHDEHNDYPFLPERMTPDNISAYTRKLRAKKTGRKSDSEFKACEKLIPHLGARRNYVLHYRNLKQALQNGLVLIKIRRVMWFKQCRWMKSFIDFNTVKRTQASEVNNVFEVEFYKLMSNSVFGKTMENKRKHSDMKMTREEHPGDVGRTEKYMSMMNLRSFPSIYHGMLFFQFKKPCVVLDKPIQVGMAILDLSKTYMYDFYYRELKAVYGDRVKLIFTDTDSFCVEIKTKDFYQDIRDGKKEDLYDLSAYPKDHFMYDAKNRKVLGKMKDETKGVEIREVVGLRPKMYSCDLGESRSMKTHKGVPSSAMVVGEEQKLKHEHYKECLESETPVDVGIFSIRSFGHNLHTLQSTKTGLSGDDDKRSQIDKYSSYSWGHYALRE